jgi:hypothetical protein
MGGYTLYIKNNKLVFDYNYLAKKHFHKESGLEVPDGEITLGFEFASKKLDQGVGRLLINGKPTGNITLQAYPLFSGAKFAIGRYANSSITKDTKAPDHFRYPGIIDRIEINTERPTDDLDLMLEVEQAHNTQ